MKFIIEIEDIYLEDNDLSTALVNRVKREIVSELMEKVSEESVSKIKEAIKSEVDKNVKSEIRKVVKATIKGEHKFEASVTNYSSDNKEYNSIYEYIIDIIKGNKYMPRVKSHILSFAESFAEELKNRYDTLFASQIVKKMADNELLNEAGVASLLSDKKKK